MNINIDFPNLYLVPHREISNLIYLEDAISFLNKQSWHDGYANIYTGLVIEGIIGVYLFEIKHSRINVDDYVWVIVGDIPPAYITCEDAPNAPCALDGYIGAMDEWVKAVQSGHSVDDLIPVNVPATSDWAKKLATRLVFLKDKVLCNYQQDLLA